MRREPTDIIVGECRDSETMDAAIQAAISGHVLTTTIHANDAVAARWQKHDGRPGAEGWRAASARRRRRKVPLQSLAIGGSSHAGRAGALYEHINHAVRSLR
jgi:hypothetical protein